MRLRGRRFGLGVLAAVDVSGALFVALARVGADAEKLGVACRRVPFGRSTVCIVEACTAGDCQLGRCSTRGLGGSNKRGRFIAGRALQNGAVLALAGQLAWGQLSKNALTVLFCFLLARL